VKVSPYVPSSLYTTTIFMILSQCHDGWGDNVEVATEVNSVTHSASSAISDRRLLPSNHRPLSPAVTNDLNTHEATSTVDTAE